MVSGSLVCRSNDFAIVAPLQELDRFMVVWERRANSLDANPPLSGHDFAAILESRYE